jgi:hypothetical protein
MLPTPVPSPHSSICRYTRKVPHAVIYPSFNSSKKINRHSSPRLNVPKSKPLYDRFYTTPAQSTPLSCPSQTKSHPSRLIPHRKSSPPLTVHSVTCLPDEIILSFTTPVTCISFFTWTPLISLGLMLDLSSVVGGYFFLGNEKQPLHINGATHVFSSIIPCIVSSAGKAE